MIDGRISASKPAGTIQVFGDKSLQADTLQCVHCGVHWVVVRGSGRRRGFCMKCMGPTCSPECSKACVPQERMLEAIEKGLSIEQMPIAVSVPRDVKG